MVSISNYLENNTLFRRVVLIVITFLYCYVTIKSFDLAYFAIEKSMPASDIAIIITSLQALMTVMIGYIFKVYSAARTKEKDE